MARNKLMSGCGLSFSKGLEMFRVQGFKFEAGACQALVG